MAEILRRDGSEMPGNVNIMPFSNADPEDIQMLLGGKAEGRMWSRDICRGSLVCRIEVTFPDTPSGRLVVEASEVFDGAGQAYSFIDSFTPGAVVIRRESTIASHTPEEGTYKNWEPIKRMSSVTFVEQPAQVINEAGKVERKSRGVTIFQDGQVRGFVTSDPFLVKGSRNI